MGEEEKKPEEAKEVAEEKKEAAEGKKEEAATEEKPKEEEKKSEDTKEETPAPPPPQEIVLRVYMHCEGCARKVRRCLKGFEGVEDVITDCRTSKVIVKGEKADPLKVWDRVKRKSHRQVELISPIPPPPEEAKKPEEKEAPKPEEKKEEIPEITVVLGVYMHCEACAQEIKKRTMRMKGVETAEADLKASQVTVKGRFQPEKLTNYVYKRTGKHAAIIKVEPEKKEEPEKKDAAESKEEKKPEEGDDKEAKKEEGEAPKENKEGEDNPPAKPEPGSADEPKMELRKHEAQFMYLQNYRQPVDAQRYGHYYYYAYPPDQMFSDENPNACHVM